MKKIALLFVALSMASCVTKKDVQKSNKETLIMNENVDFYNKKLILTHINGKDISTTNVYGMFSDTDKRFSGKSACNNFSAAYEIKGTTITFKRGMGTLMACDEETMKLENEFLNSLDEKNYIVSRNADSVVFTDEKGSETLKFHIENEEDIWSFINGKTFKLIQLDNIGQDYKKAFIQFDANEGKVSGNSSCNRFFGTYTANGNSVTFSNLGSTRMACLSDEDNKTEQKMLNYLSNATLRFDVADQTLNFYKDSRLVMMFAVVE